MNTSFGRQFLELLPFPLAYVATSNMLVSPASYGSVASSRWMLIAAIKFRFRRFRLLSMHFIYGRLLRSAVVLFILFVCNLDAPFVVATSCSYQAFPYAHHEPSSERCPLGREHLRHRPVHALTGKEGSARCIYSAAEPDTL
jgi:hypothetical protein